MVTRACGDCTLCCRLVPVSELRKPAGRRCTHQSSKGCGIYAARPDECQAWRCQWLEGSTGAIRRPDRSHYAIDPVPDVIIITQEGGERRMAAVQVWCDPMHREAHRDTALRDYIAALDVPALVRFDGTNAVVLLPPTLTMDGRWAEVETNLDPDAKGTNWSRMSPVERLAVSGLLPGELKRPCT